MIFRNTVYYASYTASVYEKLIKLSNEFGIRVRPLAWAFFFPGERCFEGTRTFSTQGINKAIFNLFALYGLLGDEALFFNSTGALDLKVSEPFIDPYAEPRENISLFNGDPERTDISGFAAKGKNGETQILVYSHHDDRDLNETIQISLDILGYCDQKGLRMTRYLIDSEHSNPYAEWVRQGSPEYPDEGQYRAVKSKDALSCVEDGKVDSAGNHISLALKLPAHSVSLIVLH
jgi:xylan 1,4-beta-xylosidase